MQLATNDAEQIPDDERAIHERARAAASGVRLPAPISGVADVIGASRQRIARRRTVAGASVAVLVVGALTMVVRSNQGSPDIRTPPSTSGPSTSAPSSTTTRLPRTDQQIIDSFVEPERLPAGLVIVGTVHNTYAAEVSNALEGRPECAPYQPAFSAYPATRKRYLLYRNFGNNASMQVSLNLGPAADEEFMADQVRINSPTLAECAKALFDSIGLPDRTSTPRTSKSLPTEGADDVQWDHWEYRNAPADNQWFVSDFVRIRIGEVRVLLSLDSEWDEPFTEADIKAVVAAVAGVLATAVKGT